MGIGDLHIDPSDDKSPVTADDQEKAEIFSDFYQSVFTIEPDGDIPLLPPKEVLHEMPKLEIDRHTDRQTDRDRQRQAETGRDRPKTPMCNAR